MEQEDTNLTIPYYVHEAEMARQERSSRRLMILCVMIFLALVVTNAGWIMYEKQFEDVTITQEGAADNGSNLTLTGVGSGTINNYGGESETGYQGETEEDGRKLWIC